MVDLDTTAEAVEQFKRELIRAQRAVGRELHERAVAEEKRRPKLAGRYRNQKCPCGSGRKAKRCCFSGKPAA